MTRIPAIPFFFVLVISAWGQNMSFLISGKQAAFVRDPARHMTLSKDCAKSAGKKGAIFFDCEAYSALAKASARGVYPRGGVSPGAIICTTKLGGEVVIGKDSAGNENAFCRFGDGSMVSCGSIAYHGRRNDLKRIE